MENKVRSAESQFCVRGSDQNLNCAGLRQDVPTKVPDLPSFGCPTTTASTSTLAETTISTAEENVTQSATFVTTEAKVENESAGNQDCCGPGLYVVMFIIIIIMLLIVLLVIYLRCKRRPKLHAKYHTSSGNGPVASDINKVEEANGTRIQNSAEAVPLKSHNWAED